MAYVKYTCLSCGITKQADGVGRAPSYCSNACRQFAYRFRKNGFQHFRFRSRSSGSGEFSKNSPLTLRNPDRNIQNVTKSAGTYIQTDWTVNQGAC